MLLNVLCFDQKSRYTSWVKGRPAYASCPVISLSDPLFGQTQDDRQKFISAYVDAIGQLSVHNDSLLWWATDISSKNRFFTPLAHYLEQFFKLLHAVDQATAQALVFVDVPWPLQGSIQQALAQKNISCAWHEDPFACGALTLKEPLARLARIIRHIFYISSRLMQARRLFSCPLAQATADPKPVYVIKTFASQRSFDAQGQYKDLFFGSLPDFISKHRRVVILADVIDDFAKTSALLKQWGKGGMYPWETFLSTGDVLRASFGMLVYAIRVPEQVTFETYNIAGLIRKVCQAHGSKIQPLHLYQYFMMKRFLKQFNVQGLVLTCEFNPWEKMCLRAVKENSPSAKTFGYQHTVVPQASVNMFTSRFEQDIIPKPDVVITVGQRPKEIIHRYETCEPSAVAVGCGLRFEYLFQQHHRKREHRGHVLLALDGLPQVAAMVNYVLQQWPSCEPCHLRIRTHPVLPVSKFAHQLSQDPLQAPRVEISKGTSLREDLEWADVVIYWGSAVALEALSMGRPVVHFENGSLLSYDPLFELNDFKWRVDAATRLNPVLQAINTLGDQEYKARQQAARNYIVSYFHPITPEAMGCFLG